VVSQTKIEFVYKELNIFRATSASSGVRKRPHLITPFFISVHHIEFLYTNAVSVCETTQ
jgi:hypothetical protein